MRKFVKKYIERFKEIKKILNTAAGNSEGGFQAKKGSAFCDGKTRIHNHDFNNDGIDILLNYWNSWDNSNLYIGSSSAFPPPGAQKITHFYNMLGETEESFRLATSFYIAVNYPDTDSRDFYFQYLDDMSKIDSYPQLNPLPTGAVKFGGWLEGKLQNVIATDQYDSPACVQVPQNFSDDDRAVANPHLLYPNPQNAVPISNYDRPALRNVYWEKGFAIVNDLASFPISTPVSTILNSTYGWQNWLVQTSDYPDGLGIMQSNTPYTPHSYKDLLYRLKAHAENSYTPLVGASGIQPGTYNYYVIQTHNGTTGVYGSDPDEFRFKALNYKAFFHSISVDMSPQELFNHVQKLMAGDDFIPNHFSNIIFLSGQSGPLAVGQIYTNAGKNSFPSNTVQAYNNALNNLPSTWYNDPSAPGGQSQWTKSEMEKQIGKVGLNRFGFQNCKGCEHGCGYNSLTDAIYCDDTTAAYPFHRLSDCQTFTSLYPEYLCEKGTPVVQDIPTEGETGDTGTTTTGTGNTGIPYFNCFNTIITNLGISSGICQHAGNITPLQTLPPNSYTSLIDCRENCMCESDCCQKEIAYMSPIAPTTPPYLPTLNTTGYTEKCCISNFGLSQGTYENTYQTSNPALTKGTYLNVRTCHDFGIISYTSSMPNQHLRSFSLSTGLAAPSEHFLDDHILPVGSQGLPNMIYISLWRPPYIPYPPNPAQPPIPHWHWRREGGSGTINGAFQLGVSAPGIYRCAMFVNNIALPGQSGPLPGGGWPGGVASLSYIRIVHDIDVNGVVVGYKEIPLTGSLKRWPDCEGGLAGVLEPTGPPIPYGSAGG